MVSYSHIVKNCLRKHFCLLNNSINSSMDSTPKPHKFPKVGESMETTEGVDRISSLQDTVLCHILSFLPTKYAVRTSILSTRWRYLFLSIPTLDFDGSLLSRSTLDFDGSLQSRSQEGSQKENEMRTFMNFVDRMFVLRDLLDVNRFRLKCGENVDALRVNAWICAALRRNVRELDLCISMKEFDSLPCNLFTCPTLAVLKLGAKFVLNVPSKICLPNLKSILLDKIEFFDDESVQNLISSCPVLEDLVVRRCGLDNICTFKVSAIALKSLTIDCSPEYEYFTKFCEYEIVVNAPNLVYLKYIDVVPEGFSMNTLESLVKAHIDVGFSDQQLDDRNHKHGESIIEIISAISEVQSLHLSGDFMKAIALSYYRLALPTFSNLSLLELGADEYVGFRMLPDLLERSPRLQNLVFYSGLLLHVNQSNCQWYPPQDVPSCLEFHLKTIEIKSFFGSKDEMNVVKYFLKNAIILKKMKLQIGWRPRYDVENRVLKLPIASKACEVEIS